MTQLMAAAAAAQDHRTRAATRSTGSIAGHVRAGNGCSPVPRYASTPDSTAAPSANSAGWTVPGPAPRWCSGTDAIDDPPQVVVAQHPEVVVGEPDAATVVQCDKAMQLRGEGERKADRVVLPQRAVRIPVVRVSM